MNPCWVLLVTRGLKVWLPPEIYLQRALAERESSRWRAILRLPESAPPFSVKAQFLHLLETRFPEPWRACPVHVGVNWSERTYPRPKIELMAADELEAAEWLRRRVPKRIDTHAHDQVTFIRREVMANVGVFRAKRVLGV